MRSLKTALLIALTGIGMNVEANSKTWLCITEKSTGFRRQNNGTWDVYPWAADQKYVIKPLDLSNEYTKKMYDSNVEFMNEIEKRVYQYQINTLGSDFMDKLPQAICAGDIVSIDCQSAFGQVLFRKYVVDLQSMKFQLFDPGNYLFRSDDSKYTFGVIEVAIGSCAAIN